MPWRFTLWSYNTSWFLVDGDTVRLFKARLDKFLMYQDVIYDFVADLTGIGDRSVRVSSWLKYFIYTSD